MEGQTAAYPQSSFSSVRLTVASPSAHMFIVNPFAGTGTWLLNMFSTHPPTDARVQKLQALAGTMRR